MATLARSRDRLAFRLREQLFKRLHQLDQKDQTAVAELVQLLIVAEADDERAEIWEALWEIILPEAVFREIAEEAVQEDARARVDAYRQKVGEQIRQRRESLGMTQEELADRAGIPQSHVSRLECGRHAPTHLTMQRVAAALDTTSAQLDPGFDS